MKPCLSCGDVRPLEVNTHLCAPCFFNGEPRRCLRCGAGTPTEGAPLCHACRGSIARILSPSSSPSTAIEPFAHTPRELDHGARNERHTAIIAALACAIAGLFPGEGTWLVAISMSLVAALSRWARPSAGGVPPRAVARGAWWRRLIAAGPARVRSRGGRRQVVLSWCGCADVLDESGNTVRDPHNCMIHP